MQKKTSGATIDCLLYIQNFSVGGPRDPLYGRGKPPLVPKRDGGNPLPYLPPGGASRHATLHFFSIYAPVPHEFPICACPYSSNIGIPISDKSMFEEARQ